MNRASVRIFAILVCLLSQAVAQTSSANRPVSTWNISTPDTGPAQGILAGVLTPTKPITIRRVEALSLRGPLFAAANSGIDIVTGDPVPCPVQYQLEITNGLVAQTIPVSNLFVQKKSTQTYTDSGPVRWSFGANNRITVSVIPPKEQFPPVHCGLVGLRITVQYEPTDEVAAKP